MKSILFCLLLFYAVNTQAKLGQVMSVMPTGKDVQWTSGFLEFENEDVKIRYSFWAEGGIMGFVIYNKSSKPIYIDWKKSAMIYNGKYLPYFTNKTTSNYTAYGVKYGNAWASIFNGTSFSSVSSVSAQETIVPQERITFIPPHSYISNAFYGIINHIPFTFSKGDANDTVMEGHKVWVSKPSNSYVVFRNFLTYSFTESFTTESNVDNEFAITRVVTMREAYLLKGDGMHGFDSPWMKTNRFYNWDMRRREVFE